MSFSIIAAVGKNRELGKRGGLVFHIPGDLKYFKEVTMGHPVVMGLNTWKSLPGKLPGRKHFVLSFDDFEKPEDVFLVSDLEKFVQKYQDSPEEVFVIGGGSVYAQMLPYASTLYLTEVDGEDKEADVFFPEFKTDNFVRTEVGQGSDNGLDYKFVKYERKAK